jgi:glycosyltransferase involved in cell wall biosynthesis
MNANTANGDPGPESLSIVIPVYRSETTLHELYGQLTESLQKLGCPYEIIFVEDCGGDASWRIIRNLASADTRVRGFKLSRNYGQHNAILCGIRNARCNLIVTMDDDLQHPPDQIELLVDDLRSGYDVVYGVAQTQQHGLLRNVASRITKFALQSVMGARNARNVSAFRVFRTDLRDAFEDFKNPFVSIDVLLSWATVSFGAVKVRHELRRSGVSNYTVGKLINHAFNLLTGFSAAPLRAVSIIGLLLTLFGFIVLFRVLGFYFLYGSPVPGFVTLATIITLFSGAQLFTLGIFGEYLARIFGRTMDRPAYVTRETTDNDSASGGGTAAGELKR